VIEQSALPGIHIARKAQLREGGIYVTASYVRDDGDLEKVRTVNPFEPFHARARVAAVVEAVDAMLTLRASEMVIIGR
jgi:hypothetical protein